jgi:hypothetical protein
MALCINQSCGAGAASNRIILMEPDPETQSYAAPAPSVPALNLMFNIGEI